MLTYIENVSKTVNFINLKNDIRGTFTKMDLRELMEITLEIVGEEASQVVEYLYSNPGHSEFDISESIGLSVSQIRSILYELKAKNLIDYDRKKDKEKGWYLYYWKVVPQNFETVYANEKKQKLEQFKERLESEENSIYYICPNFCKRLSFEDALDTDFHCPVCNSLMNEENKSRKVEMLKRNIIEHESFLAEKKQQA